MKKASKTLTWVIVLVVLAVPLVWLHIQKLNELSALKAERDTLSANLKTCQEEVTANELSLFYDVNDMDVTVTQKEVAFADLFNAEDLEAQATGDCAKTVTEGYFDELMTKFADVKGTEYTFTANASTDEKYTVTLFPNTPAYPTKETFKNDFEVCAVGSDLNPATLNESGLMFVSSCGAGYGEEVPALTCSDIQKGLTLEFN